MLGYFMMSIVPVHEKFTHSTFGRSERRPSVYIHSVSLIYRVKWLCARYQLDACMARQLRCIHPHVPYIYQVLNV